MSFFLMSNQADSRRDCWCMMLITEELPCSSNFSQPSTMCKSKEFRFANIASIWMTKSDIKKMNKICPSSRIGDPETMNFLYFIKYIFFLEFGENLLTNKGIFDCPPKLAIHCEYDEVLSGSLIKSNHNVRKPQDQDRLRSIHELSLTRTSTQNTEYTFPKGHASSLFNPTAQTRETLSKLTVDMLTFLQWNEYWYLYEFQRQFRIRIPLYWNHNSIPYCLLFFFKL